MCTRTCMQVNAACVYTGTAYQSGRAKHVCHNLLSSVHDVVRPMERSAAMLDRPDACSTTAGLTYVHNASTADNTIQCIPLSTCSLLQLKIGLRLICCCCAAHVQVGRRHGLHKLHTGVDGDSLGAADITRHSVRLPMLFTRHTCF